MTAPVVFIDTETLGLDPDHQPVWEVGFILPDGEEHEYQLRVTPRQLTLAHPIALDIGRFGERYDEAGAWAPFQIAGLLAKIIPKGAHLAGAVVSFDEERLRRLLWEHGKQVPWHYHLVDVESLAAGWLAGVRAAVYEKVPNTGEVFWLGTKAWAAAEGVDHRPAWRSEELSLAVGVDPEDFHRHTALGDARWARAIYRAVMGE